MSPTPFERLAPFLQEYIYAQGWTELRQVQIEACRVIFETQSHLLLATGTASGKTEAAFLPILTVLNDRPATTIGVLYISPIKALINDQFERLSDLLKQTHTEVWAWHGDVAQSRKRRLLKDPQGILQITPESLESLLINQSDRLPHLFGDLRFIVIDEIHAFMGSQRGGQILCQLSRIAPFCRQPVRRVGLSATLGDYSLAKRWLESGTNVSAIAPEMESGKRQVRLAVEHFEIEDSPSPKENARPAQDSYHNYIFTATQNKKCLIFTNNRSETESIIANLRHIAKTQNSPDIYHVHHGSISAALREDAETAMCDSRPAVTAATLTLELGIDIGQLERVIQINSPFSVASFLQRLGRTGRRDRPADMRFVCTEKDRTTANFFPEQIPWNLLQCIAIVQLYLEERWIEPIHPLRYPFSLLYHQTMSTLAAQGELTPAALAQAVLSLPPFAEISQADFRQLLQYLIQIEHLQKTEIGGLILGVVGEKLVRNFRFYAVFADNVEYSVKGESGEIGSISILPAIAQQFSLAGRTWEVQDIDSKRKTIFVKPVEGMAGISWRGSSRGKIHTKVVQKMAQVLQETAEYSYLQSGAKQRLFVARQLAQKEKLTQNKIVDLGDGNCCIFPWLGTIACDTLERVINDWARETIEIRKIKFVTPYYILIRLGNKVSVEDLRQAILEFCHKGLTAEDIVATVEAPQIQKYDRFIPNNLLRKAFAGDYLDLEALAHLDL